MNKSLQERAYQTTGFSGIGDSSTPQTNDIDNVALRAALDDFSRHHRPAPQVPYVNPGRVFINHDAPLPQDASVYTDRIDIAMRALKSCKKKSATAKASFAQKKADRVSTLEMRALREYKSYKSQSRNEPFPGMLVMGSGEKGDLPIRNPSVPPVPVPKLAPKQAPPAQPKTLWNSITGGMSAMSDMPQLIESMKSYVDANVDQIGDRVDKKIDEKISIVFQMLNSFADNKGKDVDQSARVFASQCFNSAAIQTNNTLGRVSGIFQNFQHYLTDAGINFLCIVLAIVAAVKYSETGSASWALLGIGSVCFFLYRNGVFAEMLELVVNLYSYYTSKDTVRPEGGADDLAQAFSTLTCIAAVGTAAPGHLIKDGIFAFSHWRSVSKNLSDCIKWISETVTEYTKKIAAHFGLTEYQDKLTGVEEVDNWIRSCSAFLRDHEKGAVPSALRATDLRALLAKGRDLVSRKYSPDESHAVQAAYRSHIAALERIAPLYAAATGLACSARQQPLGAYFYGPPGVGKTAVLMSYALAVLCHALRDQPEMLALMRQQKSIFIYSRPNYTEFWEGVQRITKAIIFNDWLQTTGIQLTREQCEVLNLADTWAMQAPMAALESKADTFLAPLVVICSSNSPISTGVGIRFEKALDRRFQIKVRVAPRKEYVLNPDDPQAQWCLDPQKVADKQKTTVDAGLDWDPDVIQFYPVNMHGKDTGENPISYKQLIEQSLSHYDRLVANFTKYSASQQTRLENNIDRVANGLRPESGKGALMSELAEQKGKAHAERQSSDDHSSDYTDRDFVTCPPVPIPPVTPQNAEEYVKMYRLEVEEILAAYPDLKGESIDEFKQLLQDPVETYRMVVQFTTERPAEDVEHFQLLWARIANNTNYSLDTSQRIASLLYPAFQAALAKNEQDKFLSALRPQTLEKAAKVAVQAACSEELKKMPPTLLTESLFEKTKTLYKRILATPILEKLATFASIVSVLAAGSSVVYLVVTLCRKVLKYLFPNDKSESDPKTPAHTSRRQQYRQRNQTLKKQSAPGTVAAEAAVKSSEEPMEKQTFEGGDLGADNIATKMTNRTQWILKTAKTEQILGTITGFHGRIYHMPMHIVAQIKGDVQMKKYDRDAVIHLFKVHGHDPKVLRKACRGESRQEMHVGDVLDGHSVSNHGSDDIWAFQWKNTNVHPVPDMRCFYMTEKQHYEYIKTTAKATLWRAAADGSIVREHLTVTPKEKVHVDAYDGTQYVLRKCYDYFVPMGSGACGSLLVIDNPCSQQHKILGAHSAGSPVRGLASIIYREDLDEVLKKFPAQVCDKPEIIGAEGGVVEPIIKPTTEDLFMDEFEILGVVDDKHAPRLGSKNQREPSALMYVECDLWEPEKAPSKLTPFALKDEEGNPVLDDHGKPVLVHPFLASVMKYSWRCMALEKFEYVRDCARQEYIDFCNFTMTHDKPYIGLWTYKQAVAGDPQDPYCKGVPRKTSAGWSARGFGCLEASPNLPGKTFWFGKDGPYTLDSPQAKLIEAEVMRVFSEAQKGIRNLHVCLDVLKDELLTLTKVENGQTRFISATSLVYQIVFRMLFGAYSAFAQRTRIANGQASGVNPYSDEWQLIADELESVTRKHMFDGDAHWLDSSIAPILGWALLEEDVLPWYQLPYDHPLTLARRTIWCDIVNSRHIFGHIIYQWKFGHPSGHSWTWLYNGKIMRIVARNAWVLVHPNGLAALSEWSRDVKMPVQGDDHVFAVAEHCIEYYNPLSIKEGFCELGIDYTTAEKTEVTADASWKTLDQVVFLKRRFRYEPTLNRYVSPLALRTIKEMVLWHPTWDRTQDVTKENFSIAMHELSQWDHDTFMSLFPVAIKAYKEAFNSEFPIQSRRVLLKRITNLTWDQAEVYLSRSKQETIGLLGSGASKGDGPGSPKNELQEVCQKAGRSMPVYKTVKCNPVNQDHCPTFQSQVFTFFGMFTGSPCSRAKIAEASAATAALSVYAGLPPPILQHLGDIQRPVTPSDADRYFERVNPAPNSDHRYSRVPSGPLPSTMNPLAPPFIRQPTAHCGRKRDLTRNPIVRQEIGRSDEFFDETPFDAFLEENITQAERSLDTLMRSPTPSPPPSLSPPDSPRNWRSTIPSFFQARDDVFDTMLARNATAFRQRFPTPPMTPPSPPLLDQDAIGMLGSGASKGDGPSRVRSSAAQRATTESRSFSHDPTTGRKPTAVRLVQFSMYVCIGLVTGLLLLGTPILLEIRSVAQGETCNSRLYSEKLLSARSWQPQEVKTDPDLGRGDNPTLILKWWISQPITSNDSASPSPANAEITAGGSDTPLDSQTTGSMLIDRPGPAVTIAGLTNIPTQIIKSNTTGDAKTIADGLGAWVEIASGTIDATSVAGTQVLAVNPGTSFFSAAYPTSLVTGKQGIRCDLIAKLLVSSADTNSGMLILSWIPMGDMPGLLSTLRCSNLTLLTQLPHVKLDIGNESSAVLDLPFVMPGAFHSFLTGDPSFGKLCLTVYSPFATGTGGTTSCSYSLLISAKPDTVQLFNPTPMTAPVLERIRPESGKGGVSVSKKGKNPADKEKEDAAQGKISGALSTVSKISAYAAETNPELAPFAAPLAWVSGIASGVAKYFGYGGPIQAGPTMRTLASERHPASANADQCVVGGNLGGLSDNAVDVMPGFAGISVDEMQLEWLLQKSYYLTHASYTTTTTVGSLVVSPSTVPSNLKATVAGPPAYFVAGPLGYLAQYFGQYHGGLRYTFRLIKTKYHQGMLMLVYYPGKTSDPGYANSIYAHREWIDVAAVDEFTFTTPFTHWAPYTSTAQSTGLLALYAVTPLRAPSTVSTSVDILVEVSAAPGFELACLQPTPFAPCIPSYSVDGVHPVKREVIRPESGTVGEGDSIAGAHSAPPGLNLARLVVGEKIMSLKQLMMMASPIILKNGYVINHGWRPFTLGAAFASAGAWANSDFSCDYVSAFAPMYLFSRGGVRLGIDAFVSAVNIVTKARIDFNLSQVNADDINSDVDHNYRWIYFNAMGADFYVPGYQKTWARLNRVSTTTGSTVNLAVEPLDEYSSHSLVITSTAQTPSTVQSEVFRSAADDYHCGFFIGCPPFASLPTNTSPPEKLEDIEDVPLTLRSAALPPHVSGLHRDVPHPRAEWESPHVIAQRQGTGVFNQVIAPDVNREVRAVAPSRSSTLSK